MIALPTHDASALLQRLMAQQGWRKSRDSVIEAIPHMLCEMRPDDVAQTLSNLKVPFTSLRCKEVEITSEECPALVLPDKGLGYLALGYADGHLTVIEAGQTDTQKRVPTRQSCIVQCIDIYHHQQSHDEAASVSEAFASLRPMLPWLIVTSFLVNFLGLLAPLLIMGIYDSVIPSSSVAFLKSIAIGVGIILLADFALRQIRSRAIAYVGRKAERSLSLSLFQKLMSLPISQLRKSDIDQQISRFRQFESLREIFTGQVMTTLLDLPFALIFLALLLYLSPVVGILTLCVVVFFAIHSLLTIPVQRRLDASTAQATQQSRALVNDVVSHQKAIVDLGLVDTLVKRSHPVIESAEKLTQKARQFQATQQTVAQTANSLAIVIAIVISANSAMNGAISFGVLIAVVTLVSKVLAPIHALHANMAQILAFRQSRNQADRVLTLPGELELGQAESQETKLRGAVTFNAVTHRPDPLNAPVLSQASLATKPRELVLVMGNDVSGRTAMLDHIDGLVTPHNGTVLHDGIDIRQIACAKLRHSITYSTFEMGLFYGTVAQNFRLAAPSLSDHDIVAALGEMGLESQDFPDGIHTRLTDELLAQMTIETRRCITLARCMARLSPIHLFSEPVTELSSVKRKFFRDWVVAQKGRRTIIIATADRSFLNLADRFVYLDAGRVTVNDVGQAGLKKIQAVLKNFEG